MAYVVIFERPEGARYFCIASGAALECLTETAAHAIRFDNEAAAHGAARHFCGQGQAFWQSEIDSRTIARLTRNGWKWRVEPFGPGAVA
jgi:hypothetical protein